MKYRVYLAGPTSILEIRVRDVQAGKLSVEEDGNYWLDDVVIPPEKLIAVVNEDQFVAARDLSHPPERPTTSPAEDSSSRRLNPSP